MGFDDFLGKQPSSVEPDACIDRLSPPPQKTWVPTWVTPARQVQNPQKQNPRNLNDFKGFCSLAGKGFEPHDLRVMSPTSYQTALPRDIRFNRRNAGHRARTGTILSYHGILSPGRLPIPPLRHIKPMGFLSLLSYYTTPPRVCQGIFKKTCADLPGFPDKFPRFPLKGGRVSRMEDVQAAGNKHEPKRVNVSRRSSRAQAG